MGRIAERAEIGVMRRDDYRAAPRREQPMELFHGANDVRDVFDDMNCADLAERVIGKWKREMIEIRDDVSTRIQVAIKADCTGTLIYSAADIED